ncbi:terminase small subunit [Gordonia phage BBQValindra]|nr:terminase small subunit [Gordonia phage BBQValindra]
MATLDFDGLEPGSKDLFDSLYATGDPESVRTLAIEAVRTWNRMCKLDQLISGDVDTWMTLVTDDSGEIRVTIDAALSAARTQASSYRLTLEQIWRQKGGAGTKPGGAGDVLAGLVDDSDADPGS